jgi:predicted ATPase
LYGQDPEVAGLSFLAWTLWLLGYPDQALARAEEAIRRAQALSHPFSLAYALTWAAVIRQHRQEVQATQERAEAVITLSTAQGFTHLLAFGTILRSWARVGQGQRDGSMAQMRRGLDAWRATGAGLHQPYFLGLLATSAAQYGHADDGLQNLLEAIALAEALGERWWASEIYRLKGEFLLAREDTGREDTGKEEAQSCLLKALDIARQQQAKVLELRAAMSLGRLWQQQGRRDEARQLLAPIYDWFTEGFDTVDLQEAQLLLEALDT